MHKPVRTISAIFVLLLLPWVSAAHAQPRIGTSSVTIPHVQALPPSADVPAANPAEVRSRPGAAPAPAADVRVRTPTDGTPPAATAATVQPSLDVYPELPADNLIVNPWFRANGRPSLAGWTATAASGGWEASQKAGNPSPDAVVGTSARLSTGRGTPPAGKTVDVGLDAFLSQVVAAPVENRSLAFDMVWVAHTIDPLEVTVYGAPSAGGPWTVVWQPFRQVYLRAIVPESRVGQDLWPYYSATTDRVTTMLPIGYPYYRIEIRGRLPDAMGGAKITGVYFAASAALSE